LITRMMRLLRSIIVLRYAHLCMGLLAFYGVSSLITYTSHFEKVMDTLKRYCYADYAVRESRFQREAQEAEFYKEKYKEKLSSLTEGLFDYRDKKEVQAFFMPKGLLYDVWWEKNRNSHLLARVIKKGNYKAEIPEEVTFDYFILGNKKIVPFPEYEKGRRARVFVSTGEKGAYIHKDSIDYLLEWYFDSLWESEPRNSKGFYIIERGYKEHLTYFLYRDLREICEDIFEKRFYRDKKKAKQYFMEEGFKVFLPTMLAMGARMVADQDSNFPSDYQYLRTCLTGLSLNPNYTMFCILKTSRPNSYNPLVRKGWKDFSDRLDITFPDEVTLDQISKISQEIFEKVENSFNLLDARTH
jgi:hypothetical protein